PFFQPFTLATFARRHPEVGSSEARGADGLVHYPKAPLRFDPTGRRPNIVWIVLDSWRADAFGAELTPEISRLAERSQLFAHHVSGGNSTRFGMFSMLYGMYAAWYSNFLEERRGPVLFPALQELGYRTVVLSSLGFPEFRRSLFVDVPPGMLLHSE